MGDGFQKYKEGEGSEAGSLGGPPASAFNRVAKWERAMYPVPEAHRVRQSRSEWEVKFSVSKKMKNGEWGDPAEDGDDPRCKSAHEAIKVSKHGFDSSVDEITRIKQALLSRRAQRAQSVT
jgi:hypothetical protein